MKYKSIKKGSEGHKGIPKLHFACFPGSTSQATKTFAVYKYLTRYITDFSSLYLFSWNNHLLRGKDNHKRKVIAKEILSRKSRKDHSL